MEYFFIFNYTLNGLIMVRLPSTTCPSCISSVYRIEQLFSKADAMIRLSQYEYFASFFIWHVFLLC